MTYLALTDVLADSALARLDYKAAILVNEQEPFISAPWQWGVEGPNQTQHLQTVFKVQHQRASISTRRMFEHD